MVYVYESMHLYFCAVFQYVRGAIYSCIYRVAFMLSHTISLYLYIWVYVVITDYIYLVSVLIYAAMDLLYYTQIHHSGRLLSEPILEQRTCNASSNNKGSNSNHKVNLRVLTRIC